MGKGVSSWQIGDWEGDDWGAGGNVEGFVAPTCDGGDESVKR